VSTRGTPVTYGVGMLGLTIPSQAFGIYVWYFYTDTLGLAAALLALARSIYSVWDAFNDPVFAYWSDRTKSRLGRRRPWMMVGLPLYMLMLVVVYSPPEGIRESNLLFYYFLVGILVFETTAAVTWTNYSALFPELFRSTDARARASAFKQAFQVVGLLLAVILVPLLRGHIGFTGMAVVCGLVGLLLLGFTIYSTREDPQAQAPEPLSLLEAFRITLSNRPFWIFAIVGSLISLVLGVLQAGIPFYVKYALGLPDTQASLLLGPVFVLSLPLVAVWARVALWRGVKPTWILAIVLFGAASLLFALPLNLYGAIAIGCLVAIGYSGVSVLGEMVLAEIIDRDAELTQRRREAIYYSVGGLISRMSGVLLGLCFALLGPLFGYYSGNNPGSNADDAFRFLMGVIPFVALSLAALIARQFPWGVRNATDLRRT
jgi:GPH family glycoside/pentoside/hexuronide:cation symporter